MVVDVCFCVSPCIVFCCRLLLFVGICCCLLCVCGVLLFVVVWCVVSTKLLMFVIVLFVVVLWVFVIIFGWAIGGVVGCWVLLVGWLFVVYCFFVCVLVAAFVVCVGCCGCCNRFVRI